MEPNCQSLVFNHLYIKYFPLLLSCNLPSCNSSHKVRRFEVCEAYLPHTELFKTLTSIYNGAFWKSILAVSCFLKTLHVRSLTGFWIPLCEYASVFTRVLLHLVALNLFCIALYEKCPNTEFFLVCIFPYLDWIQRFMGWIFVFSLNTGNYGPEKTPYLDIFHAV